MKNKNKIMMNKITKIIKLMMIIIAIMNNINAKMISNQLNKTLLNYKILRVLKLMIMKIIYLL